MAIFSIEHVYDDIIIGMWKIEQKEQDFYLSYPFLNEIKEKLSKQYQSNKRLLEVLSVEALIYEILGPNVHLHHDEKDRPFLSNNMNISISHTKGYATVIISQKFKVAIDIEYISNRVEKVAHKFIAKDERANSTLEKLLHWCTKEVLYKLYPKDNLTYSLAKIKSINKKENLIIAQNLKQNIDIFVRYKILKDIVLCFAFY